MLGQKVKITQGYGRGSAGTVTRVNVGLRGGQCEVELEGGTKIMALPQYLEAESTPRPQAAIRGHSETGDTLTDAANDDAGRRWGR